MFTVIEKRIIEYGHGYIRYRLTLDGYIPYYNNGTPDYISLIDTCDICNFGGIIETLKHDTINECTILTIKVYTD